MISWIENRYSAQYVLEGGGEMPRANRCLTFRSWRQREESVNIWLL